MNYWVCRGKPALNDWAKMLRPGKTDDWYMWRSPRSARPGDRLFFWESSPGLRLVGLGVILNPRAGKDAEGNDLFEVKYLTRPFPEPPKVYELRSIRALGDAAFLKGGPAATLLALSPEHAQILFEIAASHNPGLRMDEIWPDLAQPAMELLSDLDAGPDGVSEGQRRLRAHLMRERNRAIVVKKRDSTLRLFGRLACEVCEFDFAKNYGTLGEGFCEVHHKLLISEAADRVKTRLEDLAIVCSNCHRMIHRTNPPKRIDELRAQMNRNRN